jgi:DegV family protein with EDD domain
MIRIVMDSTADLPAELVTRYQISVVPLNLHFGTETIKADLNLDHASFYRKVEALKLIPKTSQPSPGDFIEAYRRVGQPGDEIISIHISSKLSGTFQSAELAAQELANTFRIYPFDSLSGSVGIGFMVLEAVRLIEAGKSVPDILKRLAVVRERMQVVLTPENLRYLQMSGRVNNVQALLGSVLNLRPIIIVDKGLLQPIARIRTRNKALEYLLTFMKEKFAAQAVNLAVVHAQVPDEAMALMNRVRQELNVKESFVCEMAVVVAAHLGPGCIGLIAYAI